MKKIEVINPFRSPVFHEEITDSTMNVSRKLASEGYDNGTVIAADFQKAGRGRVPGRKWEMQKNCGLSFTVLLRFQDIEHIPSSLTLRTGLTLSEAIEEFIPSLNEKVKIKWPNDIMINSKKTAGILCEADGGIVHIGIGINFLQKEFPQSIKEKATSLSLASGIEFNYEERFLLLEKILAALFFELKNEKSNNLKERLEKRLFKKGESVIFIDGAADSGNEIRGILAGINDNGELLIIPEGEKNTRAFITGELKY